MQQTIRRTGASHPDLRLNYLRVIAAGVQHIANAAKVPTPKAGDLADIEFLDGVVVRITFFSDPTSIANLTPLLDERARG